ncbi:hypothetical protein K438DRAFT_1999045 [Mycena galopus ATCC 62051]|nr:hypothetical protein K438DRAFT_1999045 [Mycena galopus ATCC 62051]
MTLKPIPPTRYDGEPDANAIQQFAQEATTYVKMGHVPKDQQVYYVSYYLDGKALNFYNQVVSKDEENWDLKRFFIELFEFCFPVDFRNAQRKQLNCCFQGMKTVATHVAEWQHIWNTIGLEDTQEKIVKLFNSFTYPVQTEIYRKNIDPEVNAWDEVVKAVEQAEVLLKLANRNQDSNGGSSKRLAQTQQKQNGSSRDSNSQGGQRSSRGGFRGCGRGRGGRVQFSLPREEVMRTSSAGMNEKPGGMSDQKRNEMLAKGLCFTCGEPGHLARNCSKTRAAPSKMKNRPPGLHVHFAEMGMQGSSSHDALNESTEVLETFQVGAVRFGNLHGVEEGGEPLQTFVDSSVDSETEFDLVSEISSTNEINSVPERPIGDIYAMYTELMLQSAQPYPGDERFVSPEECWSERRFWMYRISDTEYIVEDHSHNEGLVLNAELLRNPDFMPALWYAQTRAAYLGLDSESALAEPRYLEEIGDVPAGAVQVLLEKYDVSEGVPVEDKFEVQPQGEALVISDRQNATCVFLSRKLLEDHRFDLGEWYNRAVSENCSTDSSEYDLLEVTDSESELWQKTSEISELPSLLTVSDSEKEESESYLPSLKTVSDSSDAGSDCSELTSLVMPGEEGESFEDRLKFWAQVSQECCGTSEDTDQPARAQRLGDVLGNTLAALLEFFQPYLGDESIPWSDERRDRKRFRFSRASEEHFVIEDTYSDEVVTLPLEYVREPKFHLLDWYARQKSVTLNREYRCSLIHQFPIEEILADAIRQYFLDIAALAPMFHGVGIERVLREPDCLEGPDEFLLSIPVGESDLHELIAEELLLNPRLDLVGWVLKKQLKCVLRESDAYYGWENSHRDGYFDELFTATEPDVEGEFLLHCGGVQIPADSVKGIARTASMPRLSDQVVARPLVIVVRVNGKPVRALVDSGSLGDLVSTSLADQLRLRRKELKDPITLQLAVQGSRSKINHSVNVKMSYQDITEERSFLVANLSGYDMILGTAWLFQHKVSIGLNPARVCVGSADAVPLEGVATAWVFTGAVGLGEHDALQAARDELLEYAKPICKTADETGLPPLRAINHTIPWIDENKILPWRPSRCPEALRPQWDKKRSTYLKAGRWQVTNAGNTAPMLLIPKVKTNPPGLRVVVDLRA